MRDLLSVLAIVAGLAITPVLAGDFQVSRPETADVVANNAAYIGSVPVASVRLCVANGYEANAMALTHRYSSGTIADITSWKKSGDARFVLVQATGSINAGQTHNIRVRDTNGLHTATTTTIQLVANATLVRAVTEFGYFTHERTISITVALTC